MLTLSSSDRFLLGNAPSCGFHWHWFAVTIRLFSCDSVTEVRLASLSVLMFVQSSDVVTIGGVVSFAHVQLDVDVCFLGSSSS